MAKITNNNTKEINKMGIDLAVILNKVNRIESDVKDITAKLDKDYVTQDQFLPVRNLAYGLVGLILTAVVGGLISLVVLK